ncbi:MAG TPA: GntR family transcriptional regulator [Pseudonocardia sp.]|jgi:DNA-binding GntR family transcriptional regulator|nr:GntR family transcriptional regulator [Pseudonocardia sp.]
MRPARREARLSRRSLGDQIADQLRQEILLGQLEPGTAISQQGLCEVYGTSRMPVRDALVKLMNEGLLHSGIGGQAVVARLTREDILDSFDIEAVVHSRAARRATIAAGEEELSYLEQLHEEMVEAHRAGDLERVGELNWAFHRTINLASGSPKLIAMMRTVSLDVPRDYLKELPGWAERANSEHAEIVAAFRARDADRVAELMQRHLERAGANLVEYLESNGRLDQAGMTVAPDSAALIS